LVPTPEEKEEYHLSKKRGDACSKYNAWEGKVGANSLFIGLKVLSFVILNSLLVTAGEEWILKGWRNAIHNKNVRGGEKK